MTVEESIKIYRFDNGKIDYPGNTQEKKKKKLKKNSPVLILMLEGNNILITMSI